MSAFTRIEAMAAVAATAILGLIVTPYVSGNVDGSKRAACRNNLRQIGAGFDAWLGDHEGVLPWLVPVANGGTLSPTPSQVGQAWAVFLAMSNHLASPRVFACPQDSLVRPATHFGTQPGGFANSAMRGNALSYFLSLHATTDLPQTTIAGDRDLRFPFFPQTCGFVSAINTSGLRNDGSPVTWTSAVHTDAGHWLQMDLSVVFQRNTVPGSSWVTVGLADLLTRPYNQDVISLHFLDAR